MDASKAGAMRQLVHFTGKTRSQRNMSACGLYALRDSRPSFISGNNPPTFAQTYGRHRSDQRVTFVTQPLLHSGFRLPNRLGNRTEKNRNFPIKRQVRN